MVIFDASRMAFASATSAFCNASEAALIFSHIVGSLSTRDSQKSLRSLSSSGCDIKVGCAHRGGTVTGLDRRLGAPVAEASPGLLAPQPIDGGFSVVFSERNGISVSYQ